MIELALANATSASNRWAILLKALWIDHKAVDREELETTWGIVVETHLRLMQALESDKP